MGVAEVEHLQLGQPFEVYQPCVGDLGVAELERLKVGQSLEVYQPRVGNLGVRRQYFTYLTIFVI